MLLLRMIVPQWKRWEFEVLASEGMAFGSALSGMYRCWSTAGASTHPAARCCFQGAKAAGRGNHAVDIVRLKAMRA